MSKSKRSTRSTSRHTFKQTKLAYAVSTALASTLFGGNALAQDNNNGAMEEVVVSGIRGSLERAMDLKRDAVGVVDAISAEDIGKFPDTNLAESLQRISGVSIDRRNGEGAQVTIRGFQGGDNLVLLNGRVMPTADNFGGGSGAGGTFGAPTRSFNFANLASEAVSGLEVYKTSRASITSGGIGGTINIKTTRPLDNPGFQATVGGKVVHDTSNRVGDDWTPEVSGLVSWTDDAEKLGVSLTAIYQERDSGAAGAALNDWNIVAWPGVAGSTNPGISFAPGAVVENEPAIGQLYGRPNDVRLSYSDRHRERTNAQLTVQFRPQDNLTLTGDYTYAENMLEEQRGEQTFWFANGNSASFVRFDDGAVPTPIIYEEGSLSQKDNGYEQQYRQQTNTLKSLGFNAEWQVNDQFTLSFDAHDSSMDSLPTGPGGGSGEIAISVAAPVHASQRGDFSGDIPTVFTTVNDCIQRTDADNNLLFDENGDPVTNGDCSGDFSLGDFGSQVGRIWTSGQTTDLNQVRVDGSFQFEDNSRFDFGIDSRSTETRSWQSNRFMTFGNWGVSDPGVFVGTGLIEEFNLGQQFDDYGFMSDPTRQQQFGIRGDARDIMQFLVDRATNFDPPGAATFPYQDPAAVNPAYAYRIPEQRDTDNLIEEDVTALYFQFGLDGEVGGMPTHLLAGLRYEDTDVKSTSYLRVPQYLRWEDNNDFQLRQSDTISPVTVNADYDNMLPSFDFDINFRDDLKGRFSYSKSISRAPYSQMSASVSGFGAVGATLNGNTPTANAANPSLIPLESDNVDISLEWYYNDSSYVSVGLFEKRVSNFIGNEQVDANWFGIRDQTNGPRVEAAKEALDDLGVLVNDTSLFVMTAVLEHPEQYPDGAADFVTDASGTLVDPAFAVTVATAYDIIPNADDPLMVFSTTTPVNNKEAKFSGAEFAVQHFFGDTGFGLQANYTVVNSDTSFNDLGDPTLSQFALTGLSDTANLVGIYENDNFQVRLAYNWRDKFLSQTNRGNSNNPTYVDEYEQVDLSVSYNVTDALTVSFEGINLTGEDNRQYGRSERQLWFLEDQEPRYQIGARYTFE